MKVSMLLSETRLPAIFFSESTTEASCKEFPDGFLYTISTASSNAQESLEAHLRAMGFSRVFEQCWVSEEVSSAQSHPLIRNFFDCISNDYDNLILKPRNIACYEHLKRVAGGTTESRYLDFGCGTGMITETDFFASVDHIIGVDICTSMLTLANSRGLATLSQREFEELSAKKFDVILSAFVLHYGIRKSTFLQIASLLKPGGCFVGNIHKRMHAEQYATWGEELAASGFRYNTLASDFGDIIILRRNAFSTC